MDSLRSSFEKELRLKISQKATAHSSEETVIVKSLKYFDLENTGLISRENFLKAVEKIGIQIYSNEDFFEIFNSYDSDNDGYLNIKEFASKLYNSELETSNLPSVFNQNRSQIFQQEFDGVEEAIEAIKKRTKDRILVLGLLFKELDLNGNGQISLDEFLSAFHSFHIDLRDHELTKVFNFFDKNNDGLLEYIEFINSVKNNMNSMRKKLVDEVFDKIDQNRTGEIEKEQLLYAFNSKNHPDVKGGRKSEDDAIREFIDFLEIYYQYKGLSINDKLNKKNFVELYTFLSLGIEADYIFENLLNAVWRTQENYNSGWLGNSKALNNNNKNGKMLESSQLVQTVPRSLSNADSLSRQSVNLAKETTQANKEINISDSQSVRSIQETFDRNNL